MRKKNFLLSITMLMLSVLLPTQTTTKHLPAVRTWNSRAIKVVHAIKTSSQRKQNIQKQVPLLSTGDGTVIWSAVIWSKEWQDNDFGLYHFNASNSISLEPVHKNNMFGVNGGGVIYDGIFHYVYYEDDGYCYVHEYNINDWSPLGNNGALTYDWLPATDVTYDPVGKKCMPVSKTMTEQLGLSERLTI
jgi:hypothetical protein